MNRDSNTGWRSWDDSRTRPYSRSSGFRSSSRPSAPRNINITSPVMNHRSPSSRSVSPGLTQGSQSPHQHQRREHSPEDSANSRWRSWRPPEDVDQKLPSAVSPPAQSCTDHAAYEEPSNDSDLEAPPKLDTELALQNSDQIPSIWDDDSWDTAELDADINAIDGERHSRSGWTPEPPDQPITNIAPATAPPPPSPPEKRVVKLYIAKDRKEAHNISINNIFMHLSSTKLMQPDGSRSPQVDSPASVPIKKNVSPFFAPEFLGNPSTDHYNQYDSKTDSNKQWQRRPSFGENARVTRYSRDPREKTGRIDDSNSSNSPEMFNRYLGQEEMEKLISEGSLYKGVININQRNRSEAYVVAESLDSDIYIGSPRMRNRAFDGDVVAVRLCDVDAVWKPKNQRAVASAPPDFDFFSFEDGEAFEHTEVLENNTSAKPKYAGEVVGILDCPKERTFVGVLGLDQAADRADPNDLYKTKQKPTRFFFRPLDKKCPLIRLIERDIPASVFTSPDTQKDTLLVAQVLNWDITTQRPTGKIIKVLGEVGDMVAETQAILAYCGISTFPYSPSALECVPSMPWNIPPAEISKRRDYRAKRCFSIDPAGARDLDDVLHIERLRDGTFEVGVHIADVSHFVKPNSPLDAEARERGSSIYLVDRVLHMLPETLCEHICSLNPGQDRLSFSVVWKLDDEANILETWFGKTVIASSAKLTYEDAQRVIDGNHLPDTGYKMSYQIEADISDLMKLSRHLRKRRFAKGALALQSVKLSVDLDDNGEPTRVSEYKPKPANDLVEEFMLLANISVAQKISSTYPNQALLRRHPEPAIRKLDKFVEMANGLGYNVDKTSSGSLQATLSAIPKSSMKDAILVLATKPMQRARYFCSGSLDITQFLHYALNEAVYTHFTSPIRRYADIVVHRQLSNALDSKAESGFSRKTVEGFAYTCNYRMEKAKAAEDQSSSLYLARFLTRTKDTNIRHAIVLQAEPDFIDVYLSEFGLQRRLYVEDLPLQGSRFNTEDETLYLYWENGVAVNLDMLTRQGFGRSKKSRPRVQANFPGTFLQKVKSFNIIDVKLEVDNQRSPPRIIMYPVNPYAGE